MVDTAAPEKPQFIINEKGEKESVILPIDKYYQLIEEIKDLAIVAERRSEDLIPHTDVVADLKNEGYL
ncbi:MAG: hypothetical protein ACQES5_03515 [Thermodesulfobacteriota bacterium]|jgi:hypothetical protein